MPTILCQPSFWIAILTINIVTYILYALDKSAARQGRRRIPERNLHLMALLGGWPGAWIAQKQLRHKTQKTRFRVVWWLTVCVNVGVVGWIQWITL